jgi:outer membrane immunogenic protein
MFMLRHRAAAGGLPPVHEARRAGRLEPLAALLGAALACAIAAAPVRADGLPDSRTILADFPLPLAYDWSGLYFGGHVIPTISEGIDGVIGGGHIGFNRQFSRWVIGAEVSLSDGDLDHRRREQLGATAFMGIPITGGTLSERADIDGLFLATARLGVAGNRWLAYLKGGYASASLETELDFRGATPVLRYGLSLAFPVEVEARTRERHHGWTIGAGLEAALTDRIIFGVEYNRIDLGSETHRDRAKFEFHDQPREPLHFSAPIDPEAVHTLWARLSFKLNRAEPPLLPPLK